MRYLGSWLVVAAVLVAPGLVAAQAAGGATPDARALLFGMADLLGKTSRMSVTVRGAYDAVQASGEKVEWNQARPITLRRPDRLRVEGERSNGARTLVVFDGKEISALPCANPTAVSVGGVPYTRCGSAWFAQVYGAGGPAFVQVQPPPGS